MKRIVTVFAAALISAGCAQARFEGSGFLGDERLYASMVPDAEVENVRVFKTAKFPLAGYDSFIVPPVAIYLNEEGRSRGVSEQDLQELGEKFRAQVIKELGSYYQIGAHPTPKTAVLRLAITDADPNLPLLNVHPGSLIIGGGLGGASAEAELVDAVSGTRIAAFLASSKGKRYEYSAGLTKWGHTEAALEDWAKLIGERVRKSHG